LFETIAGIAQTAESSGFDSVWVMDHFYQIPFVGRRTEPMLEAYALLGGIAARTSKVRLGTMVTGVTYRNPALLAKTVTTLDIISAGRAILGVGAAWNDDEHAGYGFDFPSAGERLDRLEETLQICRAMFTSEETSFHGSYHKTEKALNFPRPVTPGGPPILIGGGGEKRTLQLVARYADACNIFGDPGMIRHKLDVLERHCKDVGRDPTEITKTRLGTLMIAPSSGEAEDKLSRLAGKLRISTDEMRVRATVGDPDEVLRQAQELLDAGLDGLIFNLPDADDLDTVKLAGETLRTLF
jgi:F420-dependent oxidoreductase-like protein